MTKTTTAVRPLMVKGGELQPSIHQRVVCPAVKVPASGAGSAAGDQQRRWMLVTCLVDSWRMRYKGGGDLALKCWVWMRTCTRDKDRR